VLWNKHASVGHLDLVTPSYNKEVELMTGMIRPFRVGFALLLGLMLILAACGGAAPAAEEAPPAEEEAAQEADTTGEEAAGEEEMAEEGDAAAEEEMAEEGDAAAEEGDAAAEEGDAAAEEEMAEEGDAAAEEGDAAAEEGDAAAAGEVPAPVEISEELRQSFGGGPVGGSFQTFANAMSLIMQDRYEYLDIAAEGTGGSGENLRSVNAGDLEYGIVYAGDAFLGRQGALPEDTTEYTNLRPAAPLYGAVAHLVVSVESGIESVADLPGTRIALGNAGSGAALSAERYFTHLGLIDQMETEFLGYSQAAQAMGDGQLDGFWILTAVPNASVTEAATFTDIRLIDVYNPGVEAGFFDEYPFYTPRDLPGGTYPGNDEDVASFQDTAMFVSNQDVSEDVVYNALIAIFSEEGLEEMRTAHPAAGEMSLDAGVSGIPVTLHPGASRFWEEVGAEIPEDIAP
jgi:hypothetical protein